MRLAHSVVLVTLLALLARTADAKSNKPEHFRVTLGGVTAWVSATSTLASSTPGRYSVKNAFDGDPSTAWVEGAKGLGLHEKISIDFLGPVRLRGFLLRPGYTRSSRTLRENALPGLMSIHTEGPDGEDNHTVSLYYRSDEAKQPGGHVWCTVASMDSINLSPRLVIFPEAIHAESVSLGFPSEAMAHRPKYEDLAISEWTPILDGLDEPDRDPEPGSPPLPEPLESAVNVLHAFRPSELSPHVLSSQASLPDLFNASLGVPDWAREQLRAQLEEYGAAPGQDPAAQISKALYSKFVIAAVTVVDRPDGVRLIGEPFRLSRMADKDSGPLEQVVLFPILVLDSKYKVRGLELRTSGLAGHGCEDVLPLP